MSNGTQQDPVAVGRVLVLALVGGLTLFAGIAVFVGGRPDAPAVVEAGPLWRLGVAILALVMAVAVALVHRLVIGRLRDRNASREMSEDELAGAFLRLTVMRSALIEGTGFLGCVVYLMRGEVFGLVLAAACIVGLLLQVPSRGRLEAFRQTVTQPQ